jgi:hypothetical protein
MNIMNIGVNIDKTMKAHSSGNIGQMDTINNPATNPMKKIHSGPGTFIGPGKRAVAPQGRTYANITNTVAKCAAKVTHAAIELVPLTGNMFCLIW